VSVIRLEQEDVMRAFGEHQTRCLVLKAWGRRSV